MQFDSLSEAMTMGGHGAYVWGAYAITLVVVIVSLLRPIFTTRKLQRAIRQASARQSARSMNEANGSQIEEVVDAPQT